MKFLLIAIFLLCYSKNIAFAQSNDSINKLICKEWKIDYYILDSEKILPDSKQKNNCMVFYPNGRMSIKEDGNIKYGKWELIKERKRLMIKYEDNTEDLFILLELGFGKLVIENISQSEKLTIYLL